MPQSTLPRGHRLPQETFVIPRPRWEEKLVTINMLYSTFATTFPAFFAAHRWPSGNDILPACLPACRRPFAGSVAPVRVVNKDNLREPGQRVSWHSARSWGLGGFGAKIGLRRVPLLGTRTFSVTENCLPTGEEALIEGSVRAGVHEGWWSPFYSDRVWVDILFGT